MQVFYLITGSLDNSNFSNSTVNTHIFVPDQDQDKNKNVIIKE